MKGAHLQSAECLRWSPRVLGASSAFSVCLRRLTPPIIWGRSFCGVAELKLVECIKMVIDNHPVAGHSLRHWGAMNLVKLRIQRGILLSRWRVATVLEWFFNSKAGLYNIQWLKIILDRCDSQSIFHMFLKITVFRDRQKRNKRLFLICDSRFGYCIKSHY